MRYGLWFVVLLAAGWLVAGDSIESPDSDRVPPLPTLPLPHSGILGPGERTTYEVDLKAGDLFNARLISASGDLGFVWNFSGVSQSIDHRFRRAVPRELWFVAPVNGIGRLEIKGGEQRYKYRLEVDKVRAATATDRRVALASRRFHASYHQTIASPTSDWGRACSWRAEALGMFASGEQPRLWSMIVADLAQCYSMENQPQTAERLLSTAISHLNPVSEGALLGRLYDLRGNALAAQHLPWSAEEEYRRALDLAKKSKDLEGQAKAYNHIGVVDYIQGMTSEGCEAIRRSSVNHHKLGEASLAGQRELSYARCLMILGDMEEAGHYLQSARRLLEEHGPRDRLAWTYRELAWWHFLQGRSRPALEAIEKSLAIEPEYGAYDRLGSIQMLRGQYAEAEDAFRIALEGAIENPIDQANVLANLCDLYLKTGRLARARDHCERAKGLFEQQDAKLSLADLLQSLAEVEKLDGQFLVAERYLGTAVDLIETQRGRADLERHRLNFLEDRLEPFQALVDLRLELDAIDPGRGFRVRALETHDQMRVRSLLDHLDTDPTPTLDIPQVQAMLDENTWILVYHLGRPSTLSSAEKETETTLWRIRRHAVERFELSVKDLTKAVQKALAEFQNPGLKISSDVVQELGVALFSPVISEMETQRLVLVADGILQRLPWAALPHPRELEAPIVARHEVVLIPSLSHLTERSQSTRPSKEKLLAIFADGVYDPRDERLDSAAQRAALASSLSERYRLSRLPHSAREAQTIFELAPPGTSEAYYGFEVRRDLLLSGLLERFSILHFALHGRAESGEDPALVLSRFDSVGALLPNRLTRSDLADLPLEGVELAVLSACETGLGQQFRGEGMLHVGHSLMQAGAQRVVVSLWKVPDDSTSKLMEYFYTNLLQDEMTPSGALQQAQYSMFLEGQPIRGWGGFLIQGDWHPLLSLATFRKDETVANKKSSLGSNELEEVIQESFGSPQ